MVVLVPAGHPRTYFCLDVLLPRHFSSGKLQHVGFHLCKGIMLLNPGKPIIQPVPSNLWKVNHRSYSVNPLRFFLMLTLVGLALMSNSSGLSHKWIILMMPCLQMAYPIFTVWNDHLQAFTTSTYHIAIIIKPYSVIIDLTIITKR